MAPWLIIVPLIKYQIKYLIETNPIWTISQFNEKTRRVKRELTTGSAGRNGKFYRENDSQGTIHSDLKHRSVSVDLGPRFSGSSRVNHKTDR